MSNGEGVAHGILRAYVADFFPRIRQMVSTLRVTFYNAARSLAPAVSKSRVAFVISSSLQALQFFFKSAI